MRKFSFRPALTLRGRKFKGLRGWAGKPFHPPLTDVPVGAYVIAPAFDWLSLLLGDRPVAFELWRAATFVLIAGVVVAVPTVLTGFWDWLRSTTPGTQARRTTNAHAWTMVTLTVVVVIDLVLRRYTFADETSTPLLVALVSALVFALVTIGGTIGGSLTYDYGFNVENSVSTPVWKESETDLLPGHKG